MATLNDRVQSVYTGGDQTNPYQSALDALQSVFDTAGPLSFIFTDGTGGSDPSVQAAIDVYDGQVGALLSEISDTQASFQGYYDSYWNTSTLNYKNIPSLLLAADNIEAEVLAESGEPAKDPNLTYYALGTVSWNDTNLASYISQAQSAESNLAGITGGIINDPAPAIAAEAQINAALSIIAGLRSTFESYFSIEANAYQDGIKYVNAYAYVKTIDGNPDSTEIQDLASKFSGGLPV